MVVPFILKFYFLGFSKLGAVGLGGSKYLPGVDKSKYNFESSLTPKLLFDPVSFTLLSASLNKALWAASRFNKKSIVSFTCLSSI